MYARYNLAHIPYQDYWSTFKRLDQHGYANRWMALQSLIDAYQLPASAEELVVDFRQKAWLGCHPFVFPESEGILGELRQRGYKLGLVTNGPEISQRIKAEESGIAALMDVVLISGEEKIEKPAREIFLRAADRLGVEPSACIFVGDNPRTDICGAVSAGMKTVWFKYYFPWPADFTFRPDFTITRLGELLEIIDD